MVANGHQRPPDAAAHEIAGDYEQRDGRRQTQPEHALVDRHRQAQQRAGLRHLQALRAIGEEIDALVGEQLRRRHGEREGRQRQIEPAEAQRWKTEKKARYETDDARDRNGQPIGQAELDDKDRRAIAADGEEGAVAERKLAVVTGQEIEAEQRDGVDEHLRELIEMIAAHPERRGDRKSQREAPGETDAHQTLATIRRPNRPEGLATSTPTMMTRATDSFTSWPTT